jgi:hypothetical protein
LIEKHVGVVYEAIEAVRDGKIFAPRGVGERRDNSRFFEENPHLNPVEANIPEFFNKVFSGIRVLEFD